ncbi:hypothetical protein [Paenibacillus sp. FSL H7-0714]|uniref:hypothetical protein n=1 Tax=Paenibacillus sp. FSL H7-0714 TaxID=2954735 RepID=UPI0030FCE0FE
MKMKMKKNGVTFLLLFVLMLSLGSQVFAADDQSQVIAADDQLQVIAADDQSEVIAADDQSQVFAMNDWTSANNHAGQTTFIYGQHQYGKIVVELGTGTFASVTLMVTWPGGGVHPLYVLEATKDNPTVSTNYYLEGGKQYYLKVRSDNLGFGTLYNYLP